MNDKHMNMLGKSAAAFVFFCIMAMAHSIQAQLPAGDKHETYLHLIEKLPPALSIHVPKGFLVLDTAIGNLNLDSIPDLIMALKSPKEDTSNNPLETRRPLLILLGKKDRTYELAFQNDKVVYCISCGGIMDPFEGITIKNGFFTVEHYGGRAWRWTDFITFRFNKVDKRFYLHRRDVTTYNNGNPDKYTTEVTRVKDFGVIDFERYDNEE